MNVTTNRAITEALDTASRHWRGEYDRMTIVMVADRRREHAINLVHKAIAIAEGDVALTPRDTATLIVDHSELAFMGFDALNTTPMEPWWRQITNIVVPYRRV